MSEKTQFASRWLFPVVAVCSLLGSTLVAAQAPSSPQEGRVRIITIGAHPDDCEGKFGGTAAKFAKAGHLVKFLSMTNGDAGHQSQGGGVLAKTRYAEAQEAARRLGIAEYEVLGNHDGELEPSLEVRKQVIRAIRRWNADIVIAPRPNDYHPDHRYTGVVVQDSAYSVVVPNYVSDVPALRKNPVFLYFEDGFQTPSPFRPDVVVAIDDVWETKISSMDAHVSQMYEWLPWVDGRLSLVPVEPAARKKWLSDTRSRALTPAVREALTKRYGPEIGSRARQTEAFQLCEYGRQVSSEELQQLFPR
jgi:LmbE family N-acetylglucosaminyl deacetylase